MNDRTPESINAQVLKEQIAKVTNPADFAEMAASYDRDAEKLAHIEGLEFWAPIYRQSAETLRSLIPEATL